MRQPLGGQLTWRLDSRWSANLYTGVRSCGAPCAIALYQRAKDGWLVKVAFIGPPASPLDSLITLAKSGRVMAQQR
jgi:hypothetical protein